MDHLTQPTFKGRALVALDDTGKIPPGQLPAAAAPTTEPIVNKSSALVLADAGKLIEYGGQSLTIPLNSAVAFPVGTRINIAALWDLQLVMTPGVKVRANGTLNVPRYSRIGLTKRATDEWWVDGSLTAPFFVGAGTNGTTLTSADGKAWQVRPGAVTGFGANAVRGICWNPNSGRWIAVGDGGKIAKSDDGLVWTAVASGTTQNLRAVTPSSNTGGSFVAVGDNNTFLSSDNNGVTWSAVSATAFGGHIYTVTYVGGSALVGGVTTAGVGRIMSGFDMGDGTFSWGSADPGWGNFAVRCIAQHHSNQTPNQFVAVGDGGKLATSDTGGQWTIRATGVTSNLLSVAASRTGEWVAVGDGGAVVESDALGNVWTNRTDRVSNWPNPLTMNAVAIPAARVVALSTSAPDLGVWLEGAQIATRFEPGDYYDKLHPNTYESFYALAASM